MYIYKELQRTTTRCNKSNRCHTLERTVTRYTHTTEKKKGTASHCNALQRTATHCNALKTQRTANQCNTFQSTTTHCNTLQRTATHCNALQRTANHCNALQHRVVPRRNWKTWNPEPRTWRGFESQVCYKPNPEK